MIVKVIGIQKVNFKSTTGDDIRGTNLFVGYPNDYVEGLKTDKFFIKNSIDCSNVKPELTLDINFNRYGKVESLSIIKG